MTACEGAMVDPSDRGVLLGEGLFETIKCVGGKPLWLREHWERLVSGAQVLGIPLPLDLADLRERIATKVAESRCVEGAAWVRATLTGGPGPRGLLPPAQRKPLLIIGAGALGEPPAACTAITARTRRNEWSPLARIKSTCCLDNVLARREAAERGAQEAIVLNTGGLVAEASSANVFVVRGGVVRTPRLEDGALPGITRAKVLDLCRNEGTDVREEQVRIEDIAGADEAFLTNSLMGAVSLVALDGATIGTGRGGTVTMRMRSALQNFSSS